MCDDDLLIDPCLALATGLWLVSLVIGNLTILRAGFIVSFRGIYFGIHFPTDIITGVMTRVGMTSEPQARRRMTLTRSRYKNQLSGQSSGNVSSFTIIRCGMPASMKKKHATVVPARS